MENPLPGSTPEGNFSSNSKSEKESALSKTLRRLGIFADRSKEEHEDEKTEEKPKKFRRFFKGLFKNVVEPPAESTDVPSKRLGFEALFLGTQGSTEIAPDAQASENIEQLTLKNSYEQKNSTPPEAIEHTPVVSNEVDEARELPSSHPQTMEREESTPEPQQLYTEQYQPPFENERINTVDQTVFERVTDQPTEKEAIIERGAGNALPVVLVGAEYLARKKADKRLENRVNEKITATNKEVDRGAALQRELENLTRHNQEQIETLKRERGIITTPERNQPVERRIPQFEQRAERQQQTVDRAVYASAEQPKEQETYKIMEQVAEAAEQNVPVERVFERSHEVKDDQTTPVGAVSIGSIMDARIASQQQSGQSQTNTQPTDTSGLPVTYDKPAGDAYKQAMQRGFWAAVIIIILGTIAYLLK